MSTKEGSLERLPVIPLIGKTQVLLTKKCWMTNSEESLISVMAAEDVLIYVKAFQNYLIILMNQRPGNWILFPVINLKMLLMHALCAICAF